MAWTDDRIAVLRKLWSDGLSASQIAKELGEGVTRNAVIGKAHRLGLEKRPSPVKSDKTKKAAAAPKAAKPAAAPPPKKAAKSAPTSKVSLLDLTDRMCKWPIGHPGEEDFHFCGKASQPGMPYCGSHCLEAYQAQPPRRDRKQANIRR